MRDPKDNLRKKKRRKPRTKKELERVFPGSGDLTSLGKGIITRTREGTEQADQADDIGSTIPDNWGEIMTDDPETQTAFRNKIKGGKQDAGGDEGIESGAIPTKYQEQLSTRLQQIQDRSPTFLNDLTFFLRPLADMERDEEERANHVKPSPQSLSQFDVLREGGNPRALTGQSRAEIKKTCQRYGLGKSFQDLLVMINQLASAQSGKLFAPPPKR